MGHITFTFDISHASLEYRVPICTPNTGRDSVSHQQRGWQVNRLDEPPGKGDDAVSPMPTMLRLLSEKVRSHHPVGLAAETGDPQTALDNISRLMQMGLVIAQIHVRPTGTLVLFRTGEQYYSPALCVGGDGRETEILAELAAESGWGDLVELLDCYHSIPRDYEGPLPNLLPDDRDNLRKRLSPLGNGQTGASRAYERN
jgi:hypothetical protein